MIFFIFTLYTNSTHDLPEIQIVNPVSVDNAPERSSDGDATSIYSQFSHNTINDKVSKPSSQILHIKIHNPFYSTRWFY